MKRLTTRVVVITVGLALFFAAGTGAAWAYWTATASGNGGASGDSFPGSGAAKPSVSVAGTTVTLSFNRVTTTGSRAASAYAITRYDSAGSNPQVVASPSCSIGATVTCAINGVPLGTWRYSYQPQLGAWLGTESALSDQSFVGATKLVFTSAPVSGTASSRASIGPITVQQRDASGAAIVATSSVPVALSSSSTGSAIFNTTLNATSNASVSIPAGSSSVDFYYGDTKAASPTITASASGLTSAAQQESIGSGAASVFAVSATASATAGAQFAISVTAQDALGNTAAYSGSHTVTVTTTDGASPDGTSPTVPSTLNFTNGLATGSVTLFNASSSRTVTVIEGGISGTSGSIGVIPGSAAKLAWTGTPTSSPGSLSATCFYSCTATGIGKSGTYKATVSVTDAWGNIVSDLGSGHTVTGSLDNGGTVTFSGTNGGTLPATGPATTTLLTATTPGNNGWSTTTLTVSLSPYASARAVLNK